jgi:hypothetical protein
MNLVKQKQDQLGPTWALAADRQSIAAQDQRLPLTQNPQRLTS